MSALSLGRASFGAATITAAAPISCARRLSAMHPSVPACVVPTQMGKSGPEASIVSAITSSRSRSVSLSASPRTPRIVMPLTPAARVKSVRRRTLSASMRPSS